MSPSNSDLIDQVRRAAQDPATRALLIEEINNAASGTGGTLSGTLGAIGGAMNRQTTSNNKLGAGIGAGIGLLLRGRKKTAASTSGGYGNTEIPQATTTETVGGGPMGTATSGFTGPQPPSPAITPASLTGAATQLRTGTDKYGNNIHSTDGGATWVDDSGRAVSGPVYGEVNTGVPGPPGMRRGGRAFARGGAVDVAPQPAPKKSVLLRRPAAVPVLSTTIVIAKKPKEKEKPGKPEKKKGGGPLKPAASAPPTPFAKGGRVQVPRGSGCATRGKRFGGIY